MYMYIYIHTYWPPFWIENDEMSMSRAGGSRDFDGHSNTRLIAGLPYRVGVGKERSGSDFNFLILVESSTR
ncbi:hypothetical protein DTO271D3_8817 [Paecilomyces variotii]|nr:hypothetical protein DTO021D3_2630 [Paecilomyces variotii]KAJ9310902.1 hypothetical protein DTO271D3_8817 [Paecilomyces variotii]KAJ9393479.1 hypothetical protein DTO032I4_250 [Paecilomyces variotii]